LPSKCEEKEEEKIENKAKIILSRFGDAIGNFKKKNSPP